METLNGQFTRFAVENDLTRNDWKMIATEFGVHNIATNIDRFYRCWHFGDEYRQVTAARFFRSVAYDDEGVALWIMQRIYVIADSDSDTL